MFGVFGRLSLSVGGARRTLTAVPGGARGRPACGGAPVARSELLAAAVVAAQASEEVCGAGGCAAAALWGCQSAAASNSLSPPQVPRRPSRLLQFRRLLLRGPLTHVFSNTHCVARLLFQPRCWTACKMGDRRCFARAPVPPHTGPSRTHRSTLEAQGSASRSQRSATGRRAPAHPHKPPKASHAAAATTRAEAQHNLQNKLEVHPREPLLPRQIDKAFTSERRLQQRRPRLIQFEPHALAVSP